MTLSLPNTIVQHKDGVVWFDISTPRHKEIYTQIDEADVEVALKHGVRRRWGVVDFGRNKNRSYLYCCRYGGGRNYDRCILLHRFLLGVVDSKQVQGDHHNRDTLDNRRLNLRPASHGQNMCNRSGNTGATSKYKGVSWDSEREKWKSVICVGKRYMMKRFDDEVEAAKAYDALAIEHFGEFAYLNFPGIRNGQ